MATVTNKEIIRSEKRKTNSVTISNSIINDTNLKPLDKIVLICILSEANDVVLYQRSIANKLGVTLGTVIKSFKNLEAFGYMERKKANGWVDNYKIYEIGYVNNPQVAPTTVNNEQPINNSVNIVKNLLSKKLAKSKIGITNAVKDTIGMFKIEGEKFNEERFSLDIVFADFLKNADDVTEFKVVEALSKMSHEINLSNYSFSKNKLKESLTWLNVNKHHLKLSEDVVIDMQIEINTFLKTID